MGAGCDLVDEHAPVDGEEFDAEDAAAVEGVEHVRGDTGGVLADGWAGARRDDRFPEDLRLVEVFGDRERGRLGVAAGGDDREFALEVDEFLGDEPAEVAVELRAGVGDGVHGGVPAAVVPAGAAFQHQRRAELLEGRAQVGRVVDRAERRHGDVGVGERAVLHEFVLDRAQGLG